MPNGVYPPWPAHPIPKTLAELFHRELYQSYGIWMTVKEILRTFELEKHIPETQLRIFSGTHGIRHIKIYMKDDVIIHVKK